MADVSHRQDHSIDMHVQTLTYENVLRIFFPVSIYRMKWKTNNPFQIYQIKNFLCFFLSSSLPHILSSYQKKKKKIKKN